MIVVYGRHAHTHAYADNGLLAEQLDAAGLGDDSIMYDVEYRTLRYRFRNHFHPYTGDLVSRLVTDRLDGLQDADTDYRDPPEDRVPKLFDDTFFAEDYLPHPELVDADDHPVKEIDFSTGGAYSVYAWEAFYHVPLTVGIHLSRSGRHADAQQWFHYVFDPTDDSSGQTPQRFWKVRPFHEIEPRRVEEILVNLSTVADEQLHEETIRSLDAWKEDPFRPHVVARHRPSAFMWKAVTAYLDNLIAWGDNLFRQDTRESINDATIHYVLAAQILGPKPQETPAAGTIRPRTYEDFRFQLDQWSNTLAEVESSLVVEVAPPSSPSSSDDRLAAVGTIGQALYFCVPRNDQLLRYWDVVADRLFKIRNSLNIHGIFRQLALFEPPIDPALLAGAVAAGVDIGSVIAGINQPLPTVRFRFLLQKATELAQEVRTVGNNLQAAMEKRDAERMAILRSTHEQKMLAMTKAVRYAQWKEATKARLGLVRSLDNAFARYVHYERLLGRPADEIERPEFDDLDLDSLNRLRLEQDEPEVPRREVDYDIEVVAGRQLNREEQRSLERKVVAKRRSSAASAIDALAGALGAIPQLELAGKPMGTGGGAAFGGINIVGLMNALAMVERSEGARAASDAERASTLGGYDRREQEWANQSNNAVNEVNQLYRQVRAAQIREAVAELEYRNHLQSIEHAEEIDEFLTDSRRGKTTNEAFYAWMQREARGLHGRAFDLAFDTARKAERALQHELGDQRLTYLRYDYLSGNEGLLAGDRLVQDLKRMEIDHLERNRREYELVKDVSLLQLAPVELLRLRATGECELTIPEALYDLDGPGHYFRRIKSVAVSIPGITGPYTSVNCTLTLTRSSIRTDPITGGDYGRAAGEDPRFNDNYGSTESIVTSSARNDAGMFELNLGDERYLPFEGHGAISTWTLRLPANPSDGDVRTFDYDTISDVVVHVRFTAREGGDPLKAAAKAHLANAIAATDGSSPGAMRLFDIRREFPQSWAAFKADPGDGGAFALSFELTNAHYPYWAGDRLVEDAPVASATFYAVTDAAPTFTPAGGGGAIALDGDGPGSVVVGNYPVGERPNPVGTIEGSFDSNDIDELWLAVQWATQA